jgi:hypothetical protein
MGAGLLVSGARILHIPQTEGPKITNDAISEVISANTFGQPGFRPKRRQEPRRPPDAELGLPPMRRANGSSSSTGFPQYSAGSSATRPSGRRRMT